MKFMKKNKKGFTLVELMIVVVIMAILVAVAVPIYGAVTDNARKKTCIANQREIISQLNTYAMNQSLGGNLPETTFTITTGTTGDSATVALSGSGTILSAASFQKLFQTMPFCPVAGNVITATITVASSVTSITTGCTDPAHVLPK